MIAISANSRRIAQNTIMLYIRMLLIMVVTLYTSRVILHTLGIEDYGIYNVVGGVIAMLGFLKGSLGGTGSRFIIFALGEGNKHQLRLVFTAVFFSHIILAGIIIVLGETIGLWFIHNKLVIPVERFEAALWVYHCAIMTTVITIIGMPYTSLIIAYERMNIFTYLSLIEVFLKLAIVWGIVYISYDKLIVYSILYLLVQLIIQLGYGCYCTIKLRESRLCLILDRHLLKEIIIYTSWTINGDVAIMGYTQGINLLLNLFFGPIANAARGIAVQIQAAVISFVQNFQVAIKPQIIKSYAISDFRYMHALVIAASKYGFFLMLIITIPLFLCIHSVLRFWLGIVPDYTVSFVRIMLLAGLLTPLSRTLIDAIHATGDIKKFQIYEGFLLLMVVPIAYILLKIYHISPNGVILVYFLVELATQCIRIWIILPKISLSYSIYLVKVILPILLLLPFMTVPLLFISIPHELSLLNMIVYVIISFLYVVLCSCVVGLNSLERRAIYAFIKQKILLYKNKHM